ncbi:MAG: hypothetical protein AAFY28_18595 [Actinomycetota bacterium]
MRRLIGVIVLGPLVWIIFRTIFPELAKPIEERLKPILPERLLDTRPDDGDE